MARKMVQDNLFCLINAHIQGSLRMITIMVPENMFGAKKDSMMAPG